jgi:MraZ protein
MATQHLFSGSAVRPIAADGATRLPGFVLRAIARSGESGRLMLGAHESDPCISGYAESHAARLLADVERRRLSEEAAGAPSAAHHSRARRLFGSAEQASFDAQGRIVLPPLSRRRARLGALALFVGTGANFEIWDAELARSSSDESLRELAEFALASGDEGQEEEQG